MGENVCAGIFRKFFTSMQAECASLEALLDLLSANIPALADMLSLGLMEVTVRFEASPYTGGRQDVTRTCYSFAGGIDLPPYEKTYACGSGGTVTFTVNPRRQCRWDASAAADIEFLFETLALIFSRNRVSFQLEQIKKRDVLTGALNSIGFKEEVARLHKAGTLAGYTAIYSDIKNFRSTNRLSCGVNGDVILKKYFFLLRDFIGDDGLFARVGGDSFIVLIKDSLAETYLERIADISVAINVQDRGSMVHLRARSGVYDVTEKSTADDVMTKASIALLEAKKSLVHDVVFFRQEMLEASLRTQGLVSQVKDAIANMEFVVYYQPKVRLGTNVLCGCEALSRWQRDRMIFPSEFIPVLEDEGSIHNLDFYMLECVCHDIRQWLDRGIEPVRISTNFSRVNYSDDSLEEMIFSVMKKYGVEGKYLEIELTDLTDFRHSDRLAVFVNNMRARGISTAIDNFGAGHTSLNILRNLKVNTLKLDKSLVDAVIPSVQNTADKTICQAIVKLARELNIEVVAQGVESMYQSDFLYKLGCSMAQGFLYDRPLPHDDFETQLLGTRVYGL